MLFAPTQAPFGVFPVFLCFQRLFEFFSLTPVFRQHDCFNATIAPPIDCLAPVFTFSACSNQQPVIHAHDPVILRSATMDAQWQQYYWNHYLMQQHHQQLTNPDTTTSPPTTAHHTYSPTGTYGPLTHALRTHHVHHSNPYVTPPYTPPSQHTPPPQAPNSQPEFPPPPPLPLPTAEPVTPPPSTFKHSPPPPPTTRGTTAPAPPPPHIPSPTPPVPDSWNPTEQHWDSNTLHGHQLHRTIQPTQWSRKAGVAGLPTFEVFPWQLAYHGTSEFTARTLSNGKFTGFIATRSIAESVFMTLFLQQLREHRLDLDGIAEALHTRTGSCTSETPGPGQPTHTSQEHQPIFRTSRPFSRTHATTTETTSHHRRLATTTPHSARRHPRRLELPRDPTMGHYLRPHHPRSCDGSHPTAANKQGHHAAAKRSSHQIWPTPQPSQSTPHSQPTTAGGSRSSHWLLTRHRGPAATQPHQPHPTLPPAPHTFHAHPPHPIH